MPGKRSSAPFILGAIAFDTKGAAEDAVRRIANNATFNVPLLGAEKEVILDLLDRHMEAARKIGPGVKDIVVRLNEFGKRGFYILRVDATETDFSWKNCMTRPRAIDRIRSALRTVVLPQKHERLDAYFRGQDTAPCELTGRSITPHNCHVHHEDPTFASLVGSFLEGRGLVPEEIEFIRADGVEGARLGPGAAHLIEEFASYHRKHARLLVVHAHEHLSLPKGG
ncbi:MAG: DCL family protein [Myxococcales bacterium]|nr:DCL family protein [Myxococcales bacterium]